MKTHQITLKVRSHKSNAKVPRCHADGHIQPKTGNRDLNALDLYTLLQLCLRMRDEELWAEFIRRSQPLIVKVITNSMRHGLKRMEYSVIDDLVQETYLKLFADDSRPLRKFKCDHQNAIYGFLKVIACRVVHDYMRASCSQKRGNGMIEVPLDEVRIHSRVNEPEHLNRSVLLREIKEFVSAPADGPHCARDLAIFWLYYRDGFTCQAIAQNISMDLSVKGVESVVLRLTRCVRKHVLPTVSKPQPCAHEAK